jgi:hypothetical protein
MTKQKKERVQLDFTIEALTALDELKDTIGAVTRAETIRQALRWFNWIMNETQPDDTITITDRDGEILSKFKASLIHNEQREAPRQTHQYTQPNTNAASS